MTVFGINRGDFDPPPSSRSIMDRKSYRPPPPGVTQRSGSWSFGNLDLPLTFGLCAQISAESREMGLSNIFAKHS